MVPADRNWSTSIDSSAFNDSTQKISGAHTIATTVSTTAITAPTDSTELVDRWSPLARRSVSSGTRPADSTPPTSSS